MARHEKKFAVQYRKTHENGAIRASWFLTLAIDADKAILNCMAAHPTALVMQAEEFKMPIAAARLFYHSYNVPNLAKQ